MNLVVLYMKGLKLQENKQKDWDFLLHQERLRRGKSNELRRWSNLDTHKVAAILTMLLLVIGFAMWFGISGLESAAQERAGEKAATLFSEDEIRTILKFYEFVEREVRRETAEYGFLGYVGYLLSLCGIVVAIISGITAFSIPKRYLRKPLEVLEVPKTEYDKLLDVFNRHYGAEGKEKLDAKIEEYINQGLTREEALEKIYRFLKKYGFD